MFFKVLVGIDGQSRGRDAIALAGQLAAEEGRLVLAHVHPGGERFAKRAFDSDFEIQQHSKSMALLERERDSTGCDAETITIGSPSVSDGLRRVAEDVHADLLVVGSTSRQRLGRFLRDHSRAALSDASCPVAIAPVGYASRVRPLNVVGVAFSASPESHHALDAARKLGPGGHASVKMLRVVDKPGLSVTSREIDVQLQSTRRVAQEQLDELEGVDGQVISGQVGPALTEWSASLDLLVVGAPSYGVVGRLIYGSTSLHMARYARCPLLVMTAGSNEDRPPSPQQIRSESPTRAGSLA